MRCEADVPEGVCLRRLDRGGDCPGADRHLVTPEQEQAALNQADEAERTWLLEREA